MGARLTSRSSPCLIREQVNHRRIRTEFAYIFSLGLPALFLPSYVRGDLLTPRDTTQILEIQAVDPPASRSWFLDNDSIVEGCVSLLSFAFNADSRRIALM